MEKEDDALQGVIETIDLAKKHRMQLAELLESLKEAQKQISSSAQASREKLDAHFAELKASIGKALDDRLQALNSEIMQIEEKELQPLKECEAVLEDGISSTMSVLTEGKQILRDGPDGRQDAMNSYKHQANELGLSSLPEVPQLSQVACVFVDLPIGLDKALSKGIGDYGHVLPRAPVQISEIVERPGSLLVKWEEIEEEHGLDLSEFCLQFCSGSLPKHGDSTYVFNEAYKGPNNDCIVRHLCPNVTYTFRVCGRAEGATAWSPWSVPCSSVTTLPHYAWRSDTESYITSNEDKIAVSLGTHLSVLYSPGSHYTCGHSLVFKILETGDTLPEDGIGLAAHCEDTESLMRTGALFVTSEGKIFMDGQEKTTHLPPFHRGSVLTFDTEVLQPSKVRVTIDINEKAVTFDWPVECKGNIGMTSSVQFGMGLAENRQTAESTNLYYAMKFRCSEWKVSVE